MSAALQGTAPETTHSGATQGENDKFDRMFLPSQAELANAEINSRFHAPAALGEKFAFVRNVKQGTQE